MLMTSRREPAMRLSTLTNISLSRRPRRAAPLTFGRRVEWLVDGQNAFKHFHKDEAEPLRTTGAVRLRGCSTRELRRVMQESKTTLCNISDEHR